jgi:hypothetical protein
MVDLSEYERGRKEGETAATLANHAEHLDKINSSLETLAKQMSAQTLELHRISDLAVARGTAAEMAVTAVKEAEKARQEKADRTWLPWQRIVTFFAVMAALAAMINLYLSHIR